MVSTASVTRERRRRQDGRARILGWAAGLVVLSAAVAGRAEMLANLNPDALRGRSDAPRGFNVQILGDQSGLVEGRLEVTVRQGDEVLGRAISAELALTAGEQRFRMMLPSMPSRTGMGESSTQARLLSADRVYDLGTQQVSFPDATDRAMVIAAARSPLQNRDALWTVAGSLRIEGMDPDPQEWSRGIVYSSPAFLPTENVPELPEEYCAFDVFVAAETGFSQLTARQLAAMLAWVRAGGSVLVIPPEDLKPSHRDWLREVFGEAWLETHRPLSASSVAPAPGEPPHDGILLTRCGLGRAAAVATMPVAGDLELAGWRELRAFLWKFQAEHVAYAVQDGTWAPPVALPNLSPDQRASFNRFFQQRDAQPWLNTNQNSPQQLQLFEHLLPGDLRMVPLSLVAVLLVAFVAAVGPGEYFLLGRLRVRRFTWMVFPLTCMAFAWLTMAAANHYMGTTDRSRSLKILDVDPDGTELRRNQFTLRIAGRPGTTELEQQRALTTVLEAGSAIRSRTFRVPVGTDALPTYVGALPGRYTVQIPHHKWTPAIWRTWECGSDETDFPWRLPLLSSVSRHPLEPSAIWSEFEDANPGYSGAAALLRGGSLVATFGSEISSLLLRVGAELCAGPAQDVFYMMDRISPTGGNGLEDLYLTGRRDQGQVVWLLLWREGGDLVMSRTLYEDWALAEEGEGRLKRAEPSAVLPARTGGGMER